MHDDVDEPFEPIDPHFADHSQEPFQSAPFPASRSDAANPPLCPKCESTHVETRNRARKADGAIGTVAGTTSGVVFALSSPEIGLTSGPAQSACGVLSRAVIAGLIGGATGCATARGYIQYWAICHPPSLSGTWQ